MSREIELDGQKFIARSLKRKELKKLRKEKGIVLSNLDVEKAEEAMDVVFEMVFTEEENEKIDDLDNSKAMHLWTEILKETYGSYEEEKNS